MYTLFDQGCNIIDTFVSIGESFLFAPSNIPGFEDVSLCGIVLGGGLLGLLVFKAIKFVTDLIL